MKSDLTVEEIHNILSTEDVPMLAQELDKTPNHLFVIRSNYRQWVKTQNPDINYSRYFSQIGSDIKVNTAPSMLKQGRKIEGKKRAFWTEEKTRDLVEMFEKERPISEMAEFFGKGKNTILDLKEAYLAWRDRGVEYRGREGLIMKFKKIRDEKNGDKKFTPSLPPASTTVHPQTSVTIPVNVGISSERVLPPVFHHPPYDPATDPFEPLNTLIDGFKSKLLDIVVQGSLKTVENRLKIEYERGRQDGIEEGFALGKKEFESERKHFSFGKVLWDKISSRISLNEEKDENDEKEEEEETSLTIEEAMEKGRQQGIDEYRREVIKARKDV